MSEKIQSDLIAVQTRLGDTWSCLTVQRRFNELANKEDDAVLNARISEEHVFWESINLALQTTIFTGLFALLDFDEDSATLFSLIKDIDPTKSNATLTSIEGRLRSIRDRYSKFRHKLFGHNDKQRIQFAEKFNLAGFTWPALEIDFTFLDYAWKALSQTYNQEAIWSEAEAVGKIYGHNAYVNKAAQDTESVLKAIRDAELPPTKAQ